MRFFALWLCACLWFCACTPFSTARRSLVDQVARGDYDAAHKTLDSVESHTPKLIDLLDRGTILRLQKRYAESNQVFTQAENEIEELFTVSVSREATTYMVNDLTQAYPGEIFERVWVNVLKSMNYADLGNLEAALVEIRKIDLKLRVYAQAEGGDRRFINHGFAHYLSGLFHEAFREDNDARVSYWKALEGYQFYESEFGVPTPEPLRRDYLCAALRLGLVDEFTANHARWYPGEPKPDCRARREIIFLISLGKIAHKVERYWAVESFTGPVLKISYPEFVSTPYVLKKAVAEKSESVLVESLSKIARKTLANRLAAIQARATARALARAGAAAAAGTVVAKETNEAALGMIVAMLVDSLLGTMEQADTRSWLTLPSQVRMARVPVPGEAKDSFGVTLRYFDAAGSYSVEEKVLVKLSKDSLKTFVFLRPPEP